jgi:fimbrial isopeptide formation D2 family protein/LPXTG-motif cell wall-anchored protein
LLKFKNKKGSDLMKNFKRMLSLLLAVVMVIGISAFTFADEATTYSITVNDSTKGLTYEAYQIFTGTIDGKNLIVKDWGTGVDTAKLAADADLNTYVKKAEEAYDEDDETYGYDFAVELLGILGNADKTTSTLTADGYVLSGLSTGYYLVKDTTGTATFTLLKLVGDNISVTPKKDAPQFKKKVKDTNDSNKFDAAADAAIGNNGWQDSADYDIGDEVPFQLTATLGEDVKYYNAYPIVFKDTLSKGLTFVDGSITVTCDGKDVTNWFSLKKSEDGQTLSIYTKDAKAFFADDNSVIVVEYKATLNDDAVIGSAGNPNTAYLVYANNPNVDYPEYDSDTITKNNSEDGNKDEDGNPKGGDDEDVDNQTSPEDYPKDDSKLTTDETAPDKVIVFTYKVVINKVDENGKELAGAKFTLYKAKSKDTDVENQDNAKYTYEKVESFDNGTETTFTFVGLDDGIYMLVEDEAPADYNKISEPIYFEIFATHSDDAADPVLLTLNNVDATDSLGVAAVNNNTFEKYTASVSYTDGTITANIQNFKGSTLPETGGMGTKLFYVFGGLLVLGASILLITKKRMNNI